jgi:hypothetical protein
MSKTTERRGISRINTAIVAVFALAALVALVAGHGDGAVLLGVVAVVQLLSAVSSAQPEVSDETRIGGLEYRDERDRQLAQRGFAAVGIAALLLSSGAFVVTTLMGRIDWVIGGVMLLLYLVWAVATRIAVRRG